MKVAYVFRTNMASTFQLATMILPQLEKGIHGAEVVGMMFFEPVRSAPGRPGRRATGEGC